MKPLKHQLRCAFPATARTARRGSRSLPPLRRCGALGARRGACGACCAHSASAAAGRDAAPSWLLAVCPGSCEPPAWPLGPPVQPRVVGRLCEQHGVLLWRYPQLVVEGVVPAGGAFSSGPGIHNSWCSQHPCWRAGRAPSSALPKKVSAPQGDSALPTQRALCKMGGRRRHAEQPPAGPPWLPAPHQKTRKLRRAQASNTHQLSSPHPARPTN